MNGTEGFDLWWLIPLILIGLCLICCRGCCGRRQRREVDAEDDGKKRTSETQAKQGERDDEREKRADE